MPSGRSSNRSCQRSSPADAPRATAGARSSTPSCMWCAAATNGGRCRTTCRRGKRPFTTFAIWRNDGTWERSTRRCASAPGGTGTRGHAQRRDPGQSIGQDQSKGGPRGYDAHKQVKGRKRHLLVDTQGFVLKVVVSAADVQDRDGARLLAHALRLYGPDLPRLSLVWADAGYGGPAGGRPAPADGLDGRGGQTQRHAAAQRLCRAAAPLDRGADLQLVGGCRRLSKDYEYQVESSEALIYAAMSHLMLRRLTRSPARSSPAG